MISRIDQIDRTTTTVLSFFQTLKARVGLCMCAYAHALNDT